MATKHQLISDIIIRVTKGKPADDLELEPRQVEFWINLVLEGLVKDMLDSLSEDNKSIPSFFVLKEGPKPLYVEQFDPVEAEDERMYIELLKPVMEVSKDKGMVRVLTTEGTRANKTKLTDIDFIQNTEFSKPSIKNLVYYRDGKTRVIICGVPKELIDVVQFFVWYVPQANLECFDDDEELPISGDLLEELQLRVEEIAHRQMAGFGDVENDGEDNLPNMTANG